MYRLNYNKINELKEKTLERIETYKNNIELLENIKLLTTKKGESFKDLKKAFNIEELKTKVAFSYIYISVSEYDYTINYRKPRGKTNNIIYLTRRFYLDDIKDNEELEKVKGSHSIFGGGFIREHYYINTNEELEEEIKRTLEQYKKLLIKEQTKHKKIDALIKALEKLYQKLNDEELEQYFYTYEIKELL